ncbi:MAG: DUF4338 domain-containing protein [Planctomycetes bacterium]|nr:DUF4338 domain-containing protein [Planctomycetota bacterium]
MKKQESYIYSGRQFSEEELLLIREIIAAKDKPHRKEISQRVCRAIGWYRPNGLLKEMSCRNVLLKMHEHGLITLPPPSRSNGNRTRNKKPRKTAAGDPQQAVNEKLSALRPLQIKPVTDDNASLWNELMHRYHYLGYSALVGHQLRYLVHDNHGRLLAALGFAGAAWNMQAREQYITWDSAKRKENLEKIINNSRFLILPWVQVKNLASCILALSAKQIPLDWEKKYCVKPLLLETLVEDNRFEGTCYKAANWRYLGKTKGRGKYDTKNEYAAPIKSIYIYPLAKTL